MERELLFDSSTWMIWLAPFLGVLAAGLSRRRDPVIEGNRVLRHDVPARVTHWTHGIGTMALLVTGIMLGLFFTPSLVGRGEPIWALMDWHFAFAVMFLFGTFYYGANTLMANERFREHLPTKDAVDYTKRHYGLLLGFKSFTFPPERKYFESEKMAYVMAFVTTITIILTGLLKVLAHTVSVPAAIMGVATPLHDVATVAMALFFVAHVFFAVVIPPSWPVAKSMITGWVSLDHVRHEHAGWLEQLENPDRARSGRPAA